MREDLVLDVAPVVAQNGKPLKAVAIPELAQRRVCVEGCPLGYQRPQLRVVNTIVPEWADGEGDVLETYVRLAGQRRDSRPDS